MIISVESVLDSNRQSLHTVQVLFPGDPEDISMRLRKTNLVAMSPSRVSVGNPYQSLRVMLALHDAILLRISQPASQMLGPAFRRDVSLFLDSFHGLWKLFLRLREMSEPRGDPHDIATLLLTILHKVYSVVLSMKQKISLDQRASLLLAQCIADLIGSEWFESDIKTQMSISKPLSSVLHLSRANQQLKRAIEDTALPGLVNLKVQDQRFATELQVCVLLMRVRILCLLTVFPGCF